MNTQVDQLFYLIVLIFSIIVHELAHGYAALHYGDTTAKNAGRLTLNPIKHIDMFGSILFPLFLHMVGSPYMVGWAKPVPYNPNNLSDRKKGTFFVSIAGILANLTLVALVWLVLFFLGDTMQESMKNLLKVVIGVNLFLAAFNLLPIPPLDGSKILASFGSERLRNVVEYPRGPMIIVFIAAAIFLWNYISPFIFKLFYFIISLV